MSVAIYRRQSLDKLGDELGIDRQLKRCEAVAAERALEVAHVITDNDVSASKRGRPGYTRLLKMVEAGEVDTILILRIDRLLRLNDELEELIQLVESKHIRVITAEGDIDLSTPQGRLVARVLVSVARSEMEVKSARHKLANEQRAEAGLPHKGRRAYGYNSDGMTIREDEALVLKEVAHRFLSGWSLTETAYWMNAQGYVTTMGNPWYSVALRQVMTRKRYAGIREWNGVDFPAAWPAIYDEDTWARLQYTMRERSRANAGSRPVSRKYLLTGYLVCGQCGSPLKGTTARDKPHRELRRSYRCHAQHRVYKDQRAGCGKVSRNAEPLEHFIKELICYRLDSPELSSLLATDDHFEDMFKMVGQRDALVLKLDSLVDDYADGTLTKPEYVRAKARAQKTLRDVEGQIASLHQAETMNGLVEAGESVRARWDVETTGWRQQLVALLIDHITVNAGRTMPRYKVGERTYYFDSSLIDVKWRV